MNKILYTIVFLLFYLSINEVKAQYGVVVYGQEQDTLCFIPDNIVGIYHGEPDDNGISIVCPDTTFVMNHLSIDSISFVPIPDRMVLTDNIGDWSEMRLCKDGTIVMTKLENDDKPVEMFFMCPNDSLGIVISDIRFNEEAWPVELTMKEQKMMFDWIDSETFNLTLIFSDSISCKYDSIRYAVDDVESILPKRNVPDIDKKPWLTRLGGFIEFAGGAVQSFVGGAMIVGSGAAELLSAGSSTPVSLPGMGLGFLQVKGGTESIVNGIINAFTNNYATGWDNVGNTLLSQTVEQGIEKGALPLVPDKYFSYIVDSKYNWTKAGWASFFATLVGQILGNLQKPYTWFDLVRDVQRGVMTGVTKDITSKKATVRGYIWPYILESPSQKFETEYGIIVYSSKNTKERYVKKEYNGEGGIIEYTFDGLKLNTTYNYCTYYIDKTNSVSAVAEIKSFKTSNEITVQTNPATDIFEQGAVLHGKIIDYQPEKMKGTCGFYLNKTGSPKANNAWEYSDLEISNTGTFDFPVIDLEDNTTYYFRAFYYSNGNYYYYGDVLSFTTKKMMRSYLQCPDNDHPHMIDLGLPFGTLWACCNVGASSPEESGGYYAFAETEEKEYYDIDNYIHSWKIDDRWYCASPTYSDSISSTRYDVARVKWGYDWRMPMYYEVYELRYNTDLKQKTKNGVDGIEIIGKNGGSIFIPIVGYKVNDEISYKCTDGHTNYEPWDVSYYWTAKPMNDPGYYWGVCFEIGGYSGGLDYHESQRLFYGLPVRAISRGSSSDCYEYYKRRLEW